LKCQISHRITRKHTERDFFCEILCVSVAEKMKNESETSQ